MYSYHLVERPRWFCFACEAKPFTDGPMRSCVAGMFLKKSQPKSSLFLPKRTYLLRFATTWCQNQRTAFRSDMNPQKRQSRRIYQYRINKLAGIGFQYSLPKGGPAHRDSRCPSSTAPSRLRRAASPPCPRPTMTRRPRCPRRATARACEAPRGPCARGDDGGCYSSGDGTSVITGATPKE